MSIPSRRAGAEVVDDQADKKVMQKGNVIALCSTNALAVGWV